ncbi:MAG: hypothetical protein RL172_1937 [Bacteroidota bacterium]
MRTRHGCSNQPYWRRTLVGYIIMQLILLVISIVFFVGYAVLIIYYAAAWQKVPVFNGKLPAKSGPRISVIIPARNEAANIGACLQSVLNQQYPLHLFEVIVVDDYSTDNTAAIVQQYSQSSSNLHLLSLADCITAGTTHAYKKKAIEMAIQQASGELLVTTDADCQVPPNWLPAIAAFYQQQPTAFIAMPVAYHSGNSFLSIFQTLDFITLQGITAAAVQQHLHSMCNGANLAYSKQAFNAVNGFAGIDDIASGDDMLLMHKIYKQYPQQVFFLKSDKVIVKTAPMKTLPDFFNQRIRWASKADRYDDKRIIAVLLLVYLFNALLLLLPFTAIFNQTTYTFLGARFSALQCWSCLLAGKTLVEYLFIYPVARFFNQATLLWFFPVAQPFHILYTVIAGWLGKFGSYRWKGRQVQ